MSVTNRSKNLPQKSIKLPPLFGKIVEGRIEVVNIHHQKKWTPRRTLPNLSSTSAPSSMALFPLHRHTTVAFPSPPLPPASCQLSSSSASAAAHYLLIVVFLLLSSAPLLPLCHRPSAASLQLPSSSKQSLLQLNHRALPLASHRCYPPLPPHTCWLLFFVIVVSAIVAPLLPTDHGVSSAAVILHLIRRHPLPHPTFVPSPLLCVLRISWLLLAVGGGAVVAPPPP